MKIHHLSACVELIAQAKVNTGGDEPISKTGPFMIHVSFVATSNAVEMEARIK